MSIERSGHVLKYEDGRYFIEEAPFATEKLDQAKIYTKYFDLVEAQAAALRHTGEAVKIVAVSYYVCNIAER